MISVREDRQWVKNFREATFRRSQMKWQNWSLETTWVNSAHSLDKSRWVKENWCWTSRNWLLVKTKVSWVWLSFKITGRGDFKHGIEGNTKDSWVDEFKRMRRLNKINEDGSWAMKEGRRG